MKLQRNTERKYSMQVNKQKREIQIYKRVCAGS